MATKPANQFVIPNMPDPRQEYFNKEFAKIAAQNPDLAAMGGGKRESEIIGSYDLQPGQYMDLPTDKIGMARHGVEAILRQQEYGKELVNQTRPGQIDLHNEEPTTLFDAMEYEEASARRDAAREARRAESVRASQELPVITYKQVAAITESLTAFRTEAVNKPANMKPVLDQTEGDLAA